MRENSQLFSCEQEFWRMAWSLAGCACVVLLFASWLVGAPQFRESWSQGAAVKTAMVHGSVRNAGGEPEAGATVFLEDEKHTVQAQVITKDDGAFKLTTERAGTYVVRAQKAGWTGDQSEQIRLAAGETKRVD